MKLPRATRAAKRYLTHGELRRLAAAADRYETLVLVLGYTGLRWGEVAALHVSEIDFARGRISVEQSVTEVRGKLVWGTPKNHQRRAVPVPPFLLQRLEAEASGRDAGALLFTSPSGAVLRNLNFRRDVFDRAAEQAGLAGLTPHELRHTAASLAVAAGANVKAVQQMLGHASAAMTLDVYSGLFDDDLDRVAQRTDQAAREAGEGGNGTTAAGN